MTEERNWRQDRLLSEDEIDRLKNAGFDIHKLKGKRSVARLDLYKDREGNIYIKRKGGQDKGEPTGLNINDY
jgi:hypothetical protein